MFIMTLVNLNWTNCSMSDTGTTGRSSASGRRLTGGAILDRRITKGNVTVNVHFNSIIRGDKLERVN